METYHIDWHKKNLKNSLAFESKLLDELKTEIKSRVEYLNRLAYDNMVRSFQIEMAIHEKHEYFSDIYKIKLADKKYFNKSKYGCEIWKRN